MKVDLFTTVGVYSRGLDTLANILTKAVEHGKANGASEAEVLDWRLAPDMFNLRQQAHTVIRFARGWPARAIGTEVPADLPDDLDLSGLQSAIQTAKTELAALKPEAFQGRDEVPLTYDIGVMAPTFPIGQWLPSFATPNFYFHLGMAYAIARSKGVPLGKRDFFAGGL
ncbi:DUF1993 domain-containing protein [Phenylobacterium sp. J367]|uniref:DUF1993 domain-containing protein n=1 Tax=Phenylobacterium sp. J367 TaxID=2898435 RepID=UPI002150AE57|nr:DUF1993 domain-containing protein [Phenylobacterium sp. J367]MCR5880693.1 DUF1993 domain-containing protein [Phenylobacterium sp. J367]